jgi:exopolyphosphatase/guanosine-5'-triphosphate,3'-diphosphate pyrophosphatase
MFNPSAIDIEQVAALLGRYPEGDFQVVVRDRNNSPVVIKNSPLLPDGTPMPTLFWLVGKREREAVSRLEAAGYIKMINTAFPPEVIENDHLTYARERDKLLPTGYTGPRPSGGVGGSRRGVKCLHAHLAAYLAGTGDTVGRYCAQLLTEELDGPVGAIDCGSNSTRLLVLGSRKDMLTRKMQITRLGQGVDSTQAFAPSAIERTIAVLSEYRGLMDSFGVVKARAIATAAARDVLNADEFINRASEVLGCNLEILSGEEEGKLAYSGATMGLPPEDGPYLMVDIGGGSTELVLGDGKDIKALTSLAMGCVRISERFALTNNSSLASDNTYHPGSENIVAAKNYIKDLLLEAISRYQEFLNVKVLVGVAGTVSALARMNLGIMSYDDAQTHHHVLSKEFVSEMAIQLSLLSVEERVRQLHVEAGRADVILGGVLILEQVMEILRQDKITVSETDILDGVALSLIHET